MKGSAGEGYRRSLGTSGHRPLMLPASCEGPNEGVPSPSKENAVNTRVMCPPGAPCGASAPRIVPGVLMKAVHAAEIPDLQKESRCPASTTLSGNQHRHLDPPLPGNGGGSSSTTFPEASQGAALQAGPCKGSRRGWATGTLSAQADCMKSGGRHGVGRQRWPETGVHRDVLWSPQQTSASIRLRWGPQ